MLCLVPRLGEASSRARWIGRGWQGNWTWELYRIDGGSWQMSCGQRRGSWLFCKVLSKRTFFFDAEPNGFPVHNLRSSWLLDDLLVRQRYGGLPQWIFNVMSTKLKDTQGDGGGTGKEYAVYSVKGCKNARRQEALRLWRFVSAWRHFKWRKTERSRFTLRPSWKDWFPLSRAWMDQKAFYRFSKNLGIETEYIMPSMYLSDISPTVANADHNYWGKTTFF